ncbi:hypothetical protein QR680_017563 [Steinernema hermaphroditum]|uniref:ABC transporter domain-containing protein n=1 Tax=Steinernema hermaphroditum TaxID=289476 RepID=A0AA39HFN8_9BILA|nr:hypothetical protein QR680_017563 [Steinernema hermaphroditum]
MSFWRQLRVLLWKNFLLKRRKWLLTLIELFLPLTLSLILLVTRVLMPAPEQPFAETVQLAQPLPSAGLAILSTILCPNKPDWTLSKDGIPAYKNNKMMELLDIVNNLGDDGDSNWSLSKMNRFMELSREIDNNLHSNEMDIVKYMRLGKELILSWSSIEKILVNLKSASPHRQSDLSCDQSKSFNQSSVPIDYGAIIVNLMDMVVCGESDFANEASNKGSGVTTENDSNTMMKILKMMWQRGPKILYAPSGSKAVSDVIYRANATFRMLDNARNWARNISISLSQTDDNFLEDVYRRLAVLQSANNSLTNELGNLPKLESFENWKIGKESLKDVLCIISRWLDDVNMDIFRGFPDESALEEFHNNAYSESVTVIAGIIFDVEGNQTRLPKRTTFTIRQNASLTRTTRAYRNLFNYPGPSTDRSYYEFGFLFIQDVIERAIVDVHANESIREPGSFIQFIPFPCYFKDQYLTEIEAVFSLAVVLSSLYSCALLVENIVVEKEKRLKDVMHSMGMNSTVLWTSWFITQFIISTIAFITLTALLCLGGVLTYSSPFFIFILLELFGVSVIFMTMLMTTLFSKAKMATACAGIIYFITFLPYIYVTVREISTSILLPSWIKILSSLSSTTALGLSMRYVLFEEMRGTGSRFDNIFSSPLGFSDGFCIFYGLIMLLVDSLVYLILMCYLDAVIPGHNGQAKPWYFPAEVCWNKLFADRRQILDEEEIADSQNKGLASECDNFEALSDAVCNTDPIIRIKGLYKQYKKGVRKYTVYDMNLNMYRNEIVVFLGHNGAGKTTTINMITGLTSMSAGSIQVNGMDVSSSGAYERSCGICPQFNVLWDRLTVLEHLQFYAHLKSNKPDSTEIRQEIDTIIKDLELEKKRNETVSSLSGGMKRRLSIAISFVAGSQAVILDEPTAGVDPYARRAIWDLILKYKEGRTIMISTHFMEEAELLADRIAMMADEVRRRVLHNFSVEHRGTRQRKRFGPCPVVMKKSHQECTYRLPNWENKQIINLLGALKSEENRKELRIDSYGLRDGSLENVFLKLGTSEYSESKNVEDGDSNNCDGGESDFDFPTIRKVSGAHLHWQRFLSQLKKRFWSVFRNWKTIASQLVLPALFVAVGMSVGLPSTLLDPYPVPGQRSTVFYENLANGISEKTCLTDEGCLSSDLLVTSLYNPSGLNAECTIDDVDSKWMDANYPQNRNPTNLQRRAEESMFANSCRYRRFYDASFSPRLNYFFLPSYIDKKKDPESYYLTCNCNTHGVGQHCMPAKQDNKDHIILKTNDDLYDLTGLDIQKYLISTRSLYPLRYGGFSFGANVSYVPEGYGVHRKDFVRLLAVRHVSKVWYDTTAYHSPSIFLNALNNDILRSAIRSRLNVSGNPGSYGIIVRNHPFKDTQNMPNKKNILQRNDVLIALFIVIAMAFVTSSFVFSLVHERATLSTHLELLDGMPGTLYWISNLVWHLLSYVLPALMSIVIIRLFNNPLYVASENFQGITLLLFLYGWACTPLVYLISYVFHDASTAFLVVLVGNLFISVSTVFTTYMLELVNTDLKSVYIEAASTYIQYVFLIFPGFALGQGILQLVLTTLEGEIAELLGGGGKVTSIFKFPFINANLIALALLGLLSFILTLLIDVLRHRIRRCQVKDPLPLEENLHDLDDDVISEKRRVMDAKHSHLSHDILQVCGVTKKFPLRKKMLNTSKTIVAVDHLCIGLRRGECFGLLGVNGAGKSTTFRMLASLDIPTSGVILLSGRRVHDQQSMLSVGYCPQFDALHDELTVREHLEFYANICGYRSEDVKRLVRWLMYKMNLTQYRNSLADDLSGGTKRKLATAIAIVDNPPLLLFDEPSTGMDPKSRRFLWNTIRSLNAAGKSIMLTSHSMEECEELCHRIAIMVNGRLQCLGSDQQLKSKYGSGYVVRLHMDKSASSDHRRIIKEAIFSQLTNATLTDGNIAYMQFELNGADIDLAKVFSTCETLLESSGSSATKMLSYSVAQVNLANLFVSLVRRQFESPDGRLKPYLDVQPCPVAPSPEAASSHP